MARQSVKRVEPHWYVLEGEDPEASDACRFEIRALTATEQIDVLNTFATTGKPSSRTFRDCFLRGVQQIENWLDHEGRPVKSALEFLSLHDTLEEVLEVGAAVFEKSYLSEDEKKTLSSQPGST